MSPGQRHYGSAARALLPVGAACLADALRAAGVVGERLSVAVAVDACEQHPDTECPGWRAGRGGLISRWRESAGRKTAPIMDASLFYFAERLVVKPPAVFTLPHRQLRPIRELGAAGLLPADLPIVERLEALG